MSDTVPDHEIAVMTEQLPEHDGRRRWAASVEGTGFFVSGCETEADALREVAAVLGTALGMSERLREGQGEILDAALGCVGTANREALIERLDALNDRYSQPLPVEQQRQRRADFLAAWEASKAELLAPPSRPS